MKYFFASDVHLGLSTHRSALQTEQMFEEWLTMVHKELSSQPKGERGLFLVGDIFDFWFEYKRVVPMGFVTILAALKKIADDEIDVYFMPGNHDNWSRGYLENQLGLKVISSSFITVHLGDKNFYISHGDEAFSRYNLGARILYKIFNSKIGYTLFSTLVHPDIAMWFGLKWSSLSRKSKFVIHNFTGEDEPVVKEARKYLALGNAINYFVFGHLHSPIDYKLSETASIKVLGQWVQGDIVYGVFDENGFCLENYN
ncbi:MAG: UDP-2,3-diacylglucosamine diphosphatase [Rikenellaceae bacterium]